MSKVSLQYELDMKQPPTWITVTPSPTARGAFHYVQEAGDFFAGPRYYTDRKGLPSYLIKYVLSGKGALAYRGQQYVLLPGQFFWIDCVEAQCYRTAPDADSWHLLWVHFYGANSANYYEQFLALNHGANVGALPHNSAVPDHIRTILSLYQDGQSTLAQDLRVSALLTDIMAECVAARTLAGDAALVTPDCIRRARGYLLENYTEQVTLDYLGERYAIDKYYFQKLFKRHTGITPNEFLILTRLNRAKELLRTTDRRIGEIALDVGIQNPSYFIKLFQQHEGVTPGIYRQRWYSN